VDPPRDDDRGKSPLSGGFSGVGDRPQRRRSPRFTAGRAGRRARPCRKRLPWLQINLLTAFLAATVVGLFESTIAQFTALAVLLPVVAGQSRNTGAQALAVVMRGLALREVRTSQWRRVIGKECTAGLLNGLVGLL
jgi:hypothetical protein